jgi:hypothetical protein
MNELMRHPERPQNNKMQQTKLGQAMELRC